MRNYVARLLSIFQLRLLSLFCIALCASACDGSRTFKVTSTADGASGSLRAAISAANASRAAAVRIEIPAGTYDLTDCAADDTNAGGDLDLTGRSAAELVAVGSNVVIHQTCAGERVLDALGTGSLKLTGITVSGGSITASDPAESASGGGVRAKSNVTLDNATITQNSVTAAAGTSSKGRSRPPTRASR